MAKKDVTKDVQKKLPDFADAVAGLSVADLETRLLNYAKESENIDDAKDADEELQRTRELVKELGAPYAEARKMIKLKMRYIVQLIGEKGGDTSGTASTDKA